MRTIRLGRTNALVPAISLGTWGHGGPKTSDGVSVGWSGHDDDAARDALIAAHRHGITHWDTADAYGDGHSEKLIGSVWADVPRDAIFLATKVGWVRGPHRHYYEPSFMRAQCEESLRNMSVEVIDLYYFHHCDFGDEERYFEPALAAMRALQKEGKVRFIGLSDWNAGKIMQFIERVDPDVVQPYRNLVDDEYSASGLKRWVEQHDLGVAFFSPLKHGLLLGKYEEPVQFPEGDFRSRIPQFSDGAFLKRMREARREVERRFALNPEPVLQAVTGALLAGNPNATVLLGQRSRRQVESAARIGEPLSEADAAWVRKIYRVGGEER